MFLFPSFFIKPSIDIRSMNEPYSAMKISNEFASHFQYFILIELGHIEAHLVNLFQTVIVNIVYN